METKVMGLRPTRAAVGIGLVCAAIGVTACGGAGSSSSASGASTATQAAKPAGGGDVSPSGDIPDNQAYVAYAPPAWGYTVKVPEGWSRAMSNRTVTFSDKLNAIQLASGRPAAHAGQASTVHRAAGTAQRLVYTQRSAPDPVTGKTRVDAVERYVFTNGGRSAVLTLSGPKGADNVDPWRIVTDSFRWTR
jgi:hypothetical protein